MRDSNPRRRLRRSCFQDSRLRPLGQPSVDSVPVGEGNNTIHKEKCQRNNGARGRVNDDDESLLFDIANDWLY